MSNSIVTLNGTELNKIAHSSPTAEIAMTAFALRERVRHFSDLNRTRNMLMNKGEKIVDSDYIQLFKDLEKSGVGVIIYGRKNKPDRFEWYYSLKTIAKAALNKTDEKAVPIANNNNNHTTEEKPSSIATPEPKMRRRKRLSKVEEPKAQPTTVQKNHVIIVLRDDFRIEFDAPNDIKPEELNTITKTLQSIR